MSPSAPLFVKNVAFSYGAVSILNDIVLKVESGEMLGLVGPNGAGKTTLLKIITGILRPQRGQVHLGGDDILSLSPRDRARRVAMVAQSPAVPQGFTSLEAVLMGRNPHLGLLQWEGPKDLEVAQRVMELTGTLEFAHRLVTSLSGGERQRVFIARALAQEAPLLLLDEPTAHLDIGYQPLILDLIQEIRRDTGVGVVAAMHDLSLASQYCQHIAVLHQGVVYALGEPHEVITSEMVATVFRAEVSIVRHPVHGTPVVLPVGRGAHAPARLSDSTVR